jgi:uncharacterized protein (TIGR03067 family)
MSAMVLTLAAVMLAGTESPDDAGKKELQKFQGTWAFVSREVDGQQVSAEQVKNLTITFRGDSFTVKDGDKVIQAGTHKLDPTKTPKEVDSTVTEGEDKGMTRLGIYERKGDTMKACFAAPGKPRPTEFKTEANSGQFLVVIKRQESK